MKFLIPLIIVVFASVAVISLLGKKKGSTEKVSKKDDQLTFKKRLLFTETESHFYRVLLPLVPEGFFILPKVGLWAIVKNEQRAGWSKISQKQCDFVIFKDGILPEPVLVIELDDRSHNKVSAQKRDEAKDAILSSAGISSLRVPVQKDYDVVFLAEEIRRISSN